MTQDPGLATPSAAPSMLRSEERLDLHTTTVAYDLVRVRRRIVTEERIVRVQVRREELVVESGALSDGREMAGPVPGAPSGDEPLIIVLHQEVPDVALRTEAYEQVTVTKQWVAGSQQVRAELRHEVVELETTPTL